MNGKTILALAALAYCVPALSGSPEKYSQQQYQGGKQPQQPYQSGKQPQQQYPYDKASYQQAHKGSSQMGDRRDAEMTVVGKVVDAMDVSIKGAAGNGHRLVKIVNPEGKRMVLDLGTPSGLSDLQLSRGDYVIASGRSARISNKPVMYTKYIGKLYATGLSGELPQQQSKSPQRQRR